MNTTKTNTEPKVTILVETTSTTEVGEDELVERFGFSKEKIEGLKKHSVTEAQTQAQEQLDALVASRAKEAASKSKARPAAKAKASASKVKPKKKASAMKKPATKATASKRGFRGRNGRWNILNQLFDEMGFDHPNKVLLEEANRRSKAAGLEPLSSSSFSSMKSIAKKVRNKS